MSTLHQLPTGLHHVPASATRSIWPALNALHRDVLIRGSPTCWFPRHTLSCRQLRFATVKTSAAPSSNEVDSDLAAEYEDYLAEEIYAGLSEGKTSASLQSLMERLETVIGGSRQSGLEYDSDYDSEYESEDEEPDLQDTSSFVPSEADSEREQLDEQGSSTPAAFEEDSEYDSAQDQPAVQDMNTIAPPDGISDDPSKTQDTSTTVPPEEQPGAVALEDGEFLGYIDIDEDDPARYEYHRQLRTAAATGQPDYAGELLHKMQAEGLDPGPIAYHAVIMALVRQGQCETGVTVLGLMPFHGLRPEGSSFYALMYGFIRDGRPEQAFAMFHLMLQTAHPDAYIGWLTINKQLLAAEHYDLAQLALAHRARNWLPNPDLYEMILETMCSLEDDRSQLYVTFTDTLKANRANLPEDEVSESDEDSQAYEDASRLNFDAALSVLYELLEEGVGIPELRFMRPLLELAAAAGFTESLYEIPKASYATTGGRFGEYFLRSIINSGTEEWHNKLMNMGALMSRSRLRYTVGERLLIMELGLLNNENWLTMHHFEQIFCSKFYALPVADGALHHVPDGVLLRLLERLSMLRLPAQIQRVLQIMQADERHMPPREAKPLSTGAADFEGRSFITMWFDGRSYYYEPKDDITPHDEVYLDVDGVTLIDNSVVDNQGLVISPSSLKLGQLKAELAARKLPTEGKMTELRRRVVAARDAESVTLDTAIHHKKKYFGAEWRRQQEDAREAAARRKAAAKEPPKKYHTVQRWRVRDGEEVMIAEYEEEDDFRIFYGLSPNVALQDELKVADGPVADEFGETDAEIYKDAMDDEDYNDEDDEADQDASGDDKQFGQDDTPEEAAATDTWRIPRGYEKYQGQPADAPGLDELQAINVQAGLEQAVTLLHLCEELGGTATRADINKMLKVAEETSDAIAVRELTRCWHTSLKTFQPDIALDMYRVAAFVCRQAGDMYLADQVLQDMNRLLPEHAQN